MKTGVWQLLLLGVGSGITNYREGSVKFDQDEVPGITGKTFFFACVTRTRYTKEGGLDSKNNMADHQYHPSKIVDN
jgi:hypothetical protein